MNESRRHSSRSALTACALATPPKVQPPRSKRRLSRAALVTLRRRSDHDKTRVSPINKRRVISVPEEAAASAEVETSGLDRTGDPLEVWTRERRLGLRAPRSAAPLSRGKLEPPQCTPCSWEGSCLFGCHGIVWLAGRTFPRRRLDGPPTAELPHGADPGGPLPSGPVPAPSLSSKGSTGSSPAGIEAPASIAVTLSWLSPTSHKLLRTSSGTPHDDAIPVDLALFLRRLRAFVRRLSMILARDPVRPRASHCRVADEPGGARPKPFASLSLRSALTTTP